MYVCVYITGNCYFLSCILRQIVLSCIALSFLQWCFNRQKNFGGIYWVRQKEKHLLTRICYNSHHNLLFLHLWKLLIHYILCCYCKLHQRSIYKTLAAPIINLFCIFPDGNIFSNCLLFAVISYPDPMFWRFSLNDYIFCQFLIFHLLKHFISMNILSSSMSMSTWMQWSKGLDDNLDSLILKLQTVVNCVGGNWARALFSKNSQSSETS